MSVGISEAFCPFEDGEGSLVDYGWDAEPALREMSAHAGIGGGSNAFTYKGKVVFDPSIGFSSLCEDGDGYDGAYEDEEALEGMDTVFGSLVESIKGDHSSASTTQRTD